MTEPHDRPDAAELLEAVEEFLRDDVLASTEGRTQYLVRVAANVVATVSRELRLGPAQAAAHRDRLASLGFEDDAALAAAIREGELDDSYEQVKAAVWAAVRNKLEVANPRYLAEE